LCVTLAAAHGIDAYAHGAAFAADGNTLAVLACGRPGLQQRRYRPEELDRYFVGVHAFYAALPAARFPVLASIAPDMTGHDAGERFESGLDILITGLQAAHATG